MKLEFWKPTLSGSKAKATIHKSGNLGFSKEAEKLMGINKDTYAMIGTNKENNKDHNIYILLTKQNNEYALKVNKAGNYFYLNTKSFFQELGVDFQKKKIIYDISEFNENGKKIYKLVMRELFRKNK